MSNSGFVSRGTIWAPAVNYQLFWGRSFSFKTSLITAKIGNNIKETLKNAMTCFFLKSGGCMFPWQQLKLKKLFLLKLVCLYQVKVLSHGFKNYIIAFYTQKYIRSPNFIKVGRLVFSNDRPQDCVIIKYGTFYIHKLSKFLRNKSDYGILSRKY